MSYVSTDKTILKVSNLRFGYDPEEAVLYDLNLEIKDLIHPEKTVGQIIALLGPSGVGKSTLLNLIAGHLKAQSGEIKLIAHDGEGEVHIAKTGEVGVVYQDYALFDYKSVYDNLFLGARKGNPEYSKSNMFLHSIFPWKKKETPMHEAVSNIAKDFGLEEHLEKYPAELSGGQRQRVAIAQQLLFNRKILILDEPFSGLDHASKEAAIQSIQKAAHLHEYNTLIIITHDIYSALKVADTVHIMGFNPGETPGASIQKSISCIEKGLTEYEERHRSPEYAEAVKEIEDFFNEPSS
ncbi:MAG: ATP-binding cassette domain-containing protein [Bacteroidota bacterium]